MSLLLCCVLAPALLLCALKLSLVERIWEMALPAFFWACVPLFLHGFASRMSMREVESLIRARETLDSFAVLLIIEALLSLLPIAAVSLAHANAAMPAKKPAMRHSLPFLSGLMASALLCFLAGVILSKPVVQGTTLSALLALLTWPWLPIKVHESVFALMRIVVPMKSGAFSFTPLWALLSPSGVMVLYGIQIHLLNAVAGLPLWQVSLRYSVLLFIGLCGLAGLFRFVIPSWRLRIDAVMLLSLLLLMAAMFLPQLYAGVPPPASHISANWPATALLIFLLLSAMSWHIVKPGAGLTLKQRNTLNNERFQD